MSALEVRSLSVATDRGAHLLTDVRVALDAGSVLTLVGETGSGKSLLADAIMGTLAPGLRATGEVSVWGLVTAASDAVGRRAQWGRGLSLLPQEPWAALDPTMRARPQVQEVYDRVRESDADLRSNAARAEADFEQLGLSEAARKYPFQLSGGMAQRVAFAAVHAAGGRPVFLADEPTKGLDARWRDSVVSQLRGVQAEGGAVLAITHDLAVAAQLGGTMAVMLDGVIVEQGPTASVLAEPSHDYTRRLIAAQPSAWPSRPATAHGAQVLRARGLSKSFGRRTLFRDVTLDIHAGARVAIVGPSGSGKTTLGNLLLGLLAPDAGVVTRTAAGPAHRYQKIYQDPVAAFSRHATLRQVLVDVATLHGRRWADVERLCERLQLSSPLLDRRPDHVSGGELQRIALVRALLAEPVLLFADEPTSRLDPITQQMTMDVLVDVTHEHGCALVLVTHDADIARNVCVEVIELEG